MFKEGMDPAAGEGAAATAGVQDDAPKSAAAIQTITVKRKRSLPGTPDPDAEVVALSPRTLLSSSTFPCEVCGREFRRSQNLQIHRRGHNLPWNPGGGGAPKGPTEPAAGRRRVYVCPEVTCAHHDPSRALGDLTGIRKHYSRKHGERKWRCERCPRSYAVRTDWKAHARVCGSRHYECVCGSLFAGKDSFVAHRTACAAMTEGADREAPSTPMLGSAARTSTVVNAELLLPTLWGAQYRNPERNTNPH
ncbi:hypothetical protein Taro_040193 [Colocasia esculenta]|uniref:C2H2-type domain-containing protein n=1 Tax=Colocasia esculenta TaxID=4460 RepID=A0A843WIE5_COLES|nr:hypothetical protein [Colocasia esculenta]